MVLGMLVLLFIHLERMPNVLQITSSFVLFTLMGGFCNLLGYDVIHLFIFIIILLSCLLGERQNISSMELIDTIASNVHRRVK